MRVEFYRHNGETSQKMEIDGTLTVSEQLSIAEEFINTVNTRRLDFFRYNPVLSIDLNRAVTSFKSTSFGKRKSLNIVAEYNFYNETWKIDIRFTSSVSLNHEVIRRKRTTKIFSKVYDIIQEEVENCDFTLD